MDDCHFDYTQKLKKNITGARFTLAIGMATVPPPSPAPKPLPSHDPIPYSLMRLGNKLPNNQLNFKS
jgi:hypothetical protein